MPGRTERGSSSRSAGRLITRRRSISFSSTSPARSRSRAFVTVGVKTEAGSRSEEHTSELQSLMRISYAVFCLKKKKTTTTMTLTPRQTIYHNNTDTHTEAHRLIMTYATIERDQVCQ